eukprot:COSAG01_NODE_4538_length_4936_cov_3.306182_3_plen_96_part_00
MTFNSAPLTSHDTMWERTIGPIVFKIMQNLVCDDYWSIKKVLFFCCVTVGEGLITQNLVCDDYWSIKKVLFFCCVTVGEGYWSIKKTFFTSRALF